MKREFRERIVGTGSGRVAVAVAVPVAGFSLPCLAWFCLAEYCSELD